jgi:AraC-like DNA-binding protein
MPKSTSASPTPSSAGEPQYLTVDELRPHVDFVAYWRTSGAPRFQYRVPSHHFLLVESGCIHATSPAGKIVAHKGDLICLRPAQVNEYSYDGAIQYYEAHVSFAPPPMQRMSVWLDGIGPLPWLTRLGDAFPAMQRLFETLCLELNQPGTAHRLRVHGALYGMLTLICEQQAKTKAPAPAIDVWQRARFRLDTEFSKPLSIEQLAKQTGVGVDHFIRQFKKRFGLSPKTYHTFAKLRHAARRLESGGQSVKSVAIELGFQDASSLTRTFKKYLGMAPTDLRVESSERLKSTPSLGDALFPTNCHIRPPELTGDFSWVD